MLDWLKRRYGKSKPVVVVSGLPRSGTSMMMKMLQAGGMELVLDGIREADADNPKGYYEYEPVKELAKNPDKSWVYASRGKAVKIISQLLKALPDDCPCKVVFMTREMSEVLASQARMLARNRQPHEPEKDAEMARILEKHLEIVGRQLSNRPRFEVLYVHYGDVIQDPAAQARRVQAFLEIPLDVGRMQAVVDRKLYRNRGGPAGNAEAVS